MTMTTHMYYYAPTYITCIEHIYMDKEGKHVDINPSINQAINQEAKYIH